MGAAILRKGLNMAYSVAVRGGYKVVLTRCKIVAQETVWKSSQNFSRVYTSGNITMRDFKGLCRCGWRAVEESESCL